MAEAKTKPTKASVAKFLEKTTSGERRADCEAVVDMMRKATGEEPTMWGPSIVGFGRWRYDYASGASGEWPLVGFSPRKTDLVLYLMPSRYPELIARLGRCRTGKSCVYIKRLSEIDRKVLEQLVATNVREMDPQRVRPA